jgi:hypothetical protein
MQPQNFHHGLLARISDFELRSVTGIRQLCLYGLNRMRL